MPDKIIYNGKKYSLFTYPLESYFRKYPEKHPVKKEKRIRRMLTSLMREYVATFEIADNLLYLKEIEKYAGSEIVYRKNKKGKSVKEFDYIRRNWESVLDDVFPNQDSIEVDWTTGLLVLAVGEIVEQRYREGCHSFYEGYIILEIDKGNLTEVKQFGYEEYDKFREIQYLAFKKTDEYNKVKTDLQKNGYSEESIEILLRNCIMQYSSKILIE